MRLSRPHHRAGFALLVLGIVVLVAGMLGTELFLSEYRDGDDFLRYIRGEARHYEDWAGAVFAGFWLAVTGAFLWLLYDATLARLLRWIREGKAA